MYQAENTRLALAKTRRAKRNSAQYVRDVRMALFQLFHLAQRRNSLSEYRVEFLVDHSERTIVVALPLQIPVIN
jgi:hypothetical protein